MRKFEEGPPKRKMAPQKKEKYPKKVFIPEDDLKEEDINFEEEDHSVMNKYMEKQVKDMYSHENKVDWDLDETRIMFNN